MMPAGALTQATAVLLRHLPPLMGVLAFGWSAGQFLLSAVLNTTWPIGVIVATNIGVSDRQAMRAPADEAAQTRDLLRLAATAMIVALILGALFGWVVIVFATQVDTHTFGRPLLLSFGMTILSGLAAAFAQYRADLAAQLDEATRKRRDQPAIFALLASAAILFVVSANVAQFGRGALPVLVSVLTALFVVRDLRPDLLRRMLPLGRRQGAP